MYIVIYIYTYNITADVVGVKGEGSGTTSAPLLNGLYTTFKLVYSKP